MNNIRVGGLAVVLMACGGAQTAPCPEPGDDTAGGEARCNLAETPIATYRLPELPGEFDLLDETHRAAWDQAQAMLQSEAPAPPEDTSAAAVEAWANGPFAQYLTAQREALHTAETSLNQLAEGPGGVQVVSSTLVGLMYYHLAAEIMSTPIPAEVREDAAQQALYLSAVREGVAPLLGTAADRAEYCVYVAASQADALHRWRLYCYAMIGHTVVAEHRVTSLIRQMEQLSHSPEYLERRWGSPTPGARVAPGEAVVEGGLEPADVSAFVTAHQRPLVACYQRGLAEDPNLHGQVVLGFEVQRTGRVRNASATVSTLGREDVRDCLVGAFGDLTFPRPEGGAARVFVALDLRVIPMAQDAGESPSGTSGGEAEATEPSPAE